MIYQNALAQREAMVTRQIEGRGVRDRRVLRAMRAVPREEFLPEHLREFAYDDSPLPIAARQTISQPYIVAFMVEALKLPEHAKVLEIGAGSGYAAAVLGQIAKSVFTIERIEELAEQAASTLARLGYDNIEVRCGDGTRGWPEQAPFDAIVVAAGGPRIPESLKQQLKVGGHMVIPVGASQAGQELVRITRVAESEFTEDDIADVRFVPLIGEEGWEAIDGQDVLLANRRMPATLKPSPHPMIEQIDRHGEPFENIDSANLDSLMERIGDSQVVLLGEATHGTSEFYRMRERITQELVSRKGFQFVAIEADWPDAARIDHYVRHFQYPASEWTAFSRFPTWMWRNREVAGFVDWLREHNRDHVEDRRVAFYGLDLYSLHRSIHRVLEYLEEVDPDAAETARVRYGCLSPWQSDPATYGQAALSGSFRTCENEVVEILTDLLAKEWEYTPRDGERFLDAVHNARVVAHAEKYYRIMYYGSRASWNLRDRHMFATLELLLDYHGPGTRAVVWAHNSHLGNARATEMSRRGELNIGQLCKDRWGNRCYAIGFGTHSGQVTCASEWNGPTEVKEIVPSHPQSYERICHDASHPRFMLPLRGSQELREALRKRRLQRAIGVIYRPDTELASHYFECCLPDQFDEWIWFDETGPVTPLPSRELAGMPETYPFGL